MLEDQLCAFTTAGYRGEGSPDHADALVFAVTELMLKENAPIIEFYRRQAEEREHADDRRPRGSVVHGDRRWLAAAEGSRSRRPCYYMVGADGLIAVKPEDADGLIAPVARFDASTCRRSIPAS